MENLEKRIERLEHHSFVQQEDVREHLDYKKIEFKP